MFKQVCAPLDRMAKSDAMQEFSGLIQQVPVGARYLGQTQSGRQKSRFNMGPCPQNNIVQHAERAEQARFLEGTRDTQLGPPPHRRLRQFLSAQLDCTRGRLVITRQQIEQGRLAAAVGSNESMDLTRAQFERHLIECDDGTKLLTDHTGAQRCRTDDGITGLGLLHHFKAWIEAIARASRGRSGATGTLTALRGRKRWAINSKTRPIPSGTTSTTSNNNNP